MRERVSQSLGKQRALVTPDTITDWFGTLSVYLMSEVEGWQAMVADPRRCFNADESGFPMCPKTGKVLAPVGARHVYEIAGDKTQISVMAAFNAIGNYLPPLLIYPGQRLRDIGQEGFLDASYAQTESGWMTTDVFVEFLRQLFDFCVAKTIPFPIILYVDGHSTHISLAASQFCSQNQIILYCFPPNATHVLQPADHSLFGPLKKSWAKNVKQWQMDHLGQTVTKRSFSTVFKTTWEQTISLSIAVNGFCNTGLWPLDASKVDYSRLQAARLYRQSETAETPMSTRIPTSATTPPLRTDVTTIPMPSAATTPRMLTDVSTIPMLSAATPPSLLADVATLPMISAATPPSLLADVTTLLMISAATPPSLLADVTTLPMISAATPPSLLADVTTLPMISAATPPSLLADVTTLPMISAATPPSLLADVATLPMISAATPPSLLADVTTLPMISAATPPSLLADVATLPLSTSVTTIPLSTSYAYFLPPPSVSTTPFHTVATAAQLPAVATTILPRMQTVGYTAPVSVFRPADHVAAAFQTLRVPEVRARPRTILKVPSALSGHEALRLLTAKDEQKIQLLAEKEARKLERIANKKAKEEMKEKKKDEREIKRLARDLKRRAKEQEKELKSANKKKKGTEELSSDSESDEENTIQYADSDESDSPDQYSSCGICGGFEGNNLQWIGCQDCPRWYHIRCQPDSSLYDLTVSEILLAEFVCPKCLD